MRITIFGLTISSSWGNGHATPYRAILKALHREGHRIHFYEKDLPYYARHRDFDGEGCCTLDLYEDWGAVRVSALKQAANSDAVICASFCPEGSQIVDEVLHLPGPIKIFYDLDTPVTLAALESGELDYLRREQIPGFDLYLSFTGGATLKELQSQWGARLALPLYGCVDPDVHACTRPNPEFLCDLSYMGTYASDRQDKLDRLFLEPARQLPSRDFLLAGSLYPWDWQWPQNVKRFEHVSPTDHSALYSSSRMTLNITRGEMARWGYCPSGRFFEAAACGTPIVTDWFDGLDHFFDPQHELRVVNNSDDIISTLSLPDSELHQVASRARERTLDAHTGFHRSQELIAAIEQAGTRCHIPRARGEVA